MRMLTSSTLSEKYQLLIDKKILLTDGLAKEHELRMQLLRFDVALKKKNCHKQDKENARNALS